MKTARLTILAALALAWGTVNAQTTNYATETTPVRVGTLLVRSGASGGSYVNPVPYTWAALDRDALTRPASWSLENPLAPATWTSDGVARYPGNGAAAGQKVLKADPVYWEVPLTGLTDQQAARFDVLLLPAYTLVQLNSAERETLRKFCDQGGTLWVDVVGDPTVDGLNGLPVAFNVASSVGALGADLGHALLRTPNALSSVDVADLASVGGSTVRKHVVPVTSGMVTNITGSLAFQAAQMQPVMTDAVGPVVAVANVGAGAIVFTGQGPSYNLSFSFGTPTVPWALRTAFDRRAQASAKFAVNVISFAQGFSRPGGNARGTSAQKALIDAPLVKSFEERGSFQPAAGTVQSPAVMDGYLVARDGNDLVCYQADPRVNASPSSVAGGSVQLWRTTVGNFASPLVVSVPSTTLTNSNGVEPRQVWCYLNDGSLKVFSLSTGEQIASLTGLPTNSSGNAVSPVVCDGSVVVVGDEDTGSGAHLVLQMVDLATATKLSNSGTDWKVATNDIASPSAAPVAGLVPVRDNSGGVDKVLYVPTVPRASSGRTCGLTAWWLGVKGETPPIVTHPAPDTLQVTTRAFNHGALKVVTDNTKRGLRIAAFDATGAALDASLLFTGTVDQATNGVLNLQLTALGQTTDFTQVSLRLDYDVDWSFPAPVRRGEVYFPDGPDGSATVIGSPSLGPDGHILLTVGRPDDGVPSTKLSSQFYNLVEYKPGDFQVRTRWDLYDAISGGFQVAGFSSPVKYPGAVRDNDDLAVNVLPSLGLANGAIHHLRFVGSPTVRGDSVYVMASGYKNATVAEIQVGVLLCFKLDPDPVEFQLTDVPAVGRENTFNILQPDPARSVDPTAPAVFSVVNGGSITFDRGSAQGGRTKLVLRNLSLQQAGQDGSSGNLQNVISTNVPFTIIQEGTSTPLLVQPEATSPWNWSGEPGVTFTPGFANGRFSPLRYYQVDFGFVPQTPVVAGGSNLFFGGASVLPSVMVNPLAIPGYTGMLFAQDANVSLNDEFMKADPVKPWELQFQSVIAPAGNYTTAIWDSVRSNPARKWPLFAGSTSFEDLRVRTLQAALEDRNVRGLAVGEGSLFAITDTPIGSAAGTGGLYSFEKIDLLVADNQRVARFNATGTPVWTLDSTLSAGDLQATVPANTTVPLSEPVRAVPAGSSGVWVVDSGANRAVKLDRAGRELRQIASIKIHPKTARSLLAGVSSSEPLTLKSPHDLMTYTDTRSAAQVAAAFPGESIVNGTGLNERWEHVVLADTGNNRVIELVDRYLLNPDGTIRGPVRYQVAPNSRDDEGDGATSALGLMIWHTPEEFSGAGYAYSCLDRVSLTNGTPRTVYAFGFANVQPGSATVGTGSTTDASTGNGGVVVYDGPQSKVIRSFVRPQVFAGTYLGLSGANYGYVSPTTDLAQDSSFPLTGIRSVKARYVVEGGNAVLAVMVATADGVYELYESSPGVWTARWMLTNEAYAGMRHPSGTAPYAASAMTSNPLQLNAMYAERLASGDVLLVNGYVGTKIGGGSFSGEVVVLDGSFWNGSDPDTVPGYSTGRHNLGFNSLSVKFQLPPVSGARGLVRPVFAARQ